MTESLEVKLARVEEKVDQVLRRLEVGDKRFIELDDRVTQLEQRVAQFMVGIFLLTWIIPLIIEYIIGKVLK